MFWIEKFRGPAFVAAIVGSVSVFSPGFAVNEASASVQKVLFVCMHGRNKQICPQFRASLKTPDGWVEDKIAEAKLGRVVFVPKGKTYDTSPVAITALTTPNKRRTSNEVLSEQGQAAIHQTNKDASIAPMGSISNEHLGVVKLFKVVEPETKPRGFMIETRFSDKDADGSTFTIELVLSGMTERTLTETRSKLDAMVRAY